MKTDQTGRIPRLNWAFVGHTGHFVGFAMLRLVLKSSNLYVSVILVCLPSTMVNSTSIEDVMWWSYIVHCAQLTFTHTADIHSGDWPVWRKCLYVILPLIISNHCYGWLGNWIGWRGCAGDWGGGWGGLGIGMGWGEWDSQSMWREVTASLLQFQNESNPVGTTASQGLWKLVLRHFLRSKIV